MWQDESTANYSKYFNNKKLIVSGKVTRSVSGGRSEIPSPNYGSTAPVMQNPHPCQFSTSKLPLKMVVSDVVHRDCGAVQKRLPTSSRFIVTPRSRSSPYDYYRNVIHRRSQISRNHPVVEEMQKKFNSIYGHNFQNATTGTPGSSIALAHGSLTETDCIEQESSIPKFSNFYKEFLLNQQSASEERRIPESYVHNNDDKYKSEENETENNETENNETKEDNTNKVQPQFMLTKNFLHTITEKQSESKGEDKSPSKYSKKKSEDEYSSSSSEEYSTESDGFYFSPVSEEKKEGFIANRNEIIPQSWTLNHNYATADKNNCSVGKASVYGETPVSNTSEEVHPYVDTSGF